MDAQRIGIYAGTFDPITNGHVDILQRALKVFDTVHVAVADSTPKTTKFSITERLELLNGAVAALPGKERIVVSSFSGLLVDYVHSVKGTAIIRGLRAVSDYEYEAQMAHINRHLANEIETVFLVTSQKCSFISSSIVKEIARNGGDVSMLVPANVAARLTPPAKGAGRP